MQDARAAGPGVAPLPRPCAAPTAAAAPTCLLPRRAQPLPGVPGGRGVSPGAALRPPRRRRPRPRRLRVPYHAAAPGGSKAPRRAGHFFLGNFLRVGRAAPAGQEKLSAPGGCDHPGTSPRFKPSPSAPRPPRGPAACGRPRGRRRPFAFSSERRARPARFWDCAPTARGPPEERGGRVDGRLGLQCSFAP